MSLVHRPFAALAALVDSIDLYSDNASAMLANLAASYAPRKVEPTERKAKGQTPLAKAKAERKAKAEQPAPAPNPAPPPPQPVLGTAGALDAVGFFRLANRITTFYVGYRVCREDAVDNMGPTDMARGMLAISAFVGYDRREVFGVQEFNARAIARATLRPVTAADKPYTRGASPTLHGFVTGMPDAFGKHVGDLVGRIRLAKHTADECEKVGVRNETGEVVHPVCQALTLDGAGAPCCCQAHMNAAVERARAATYQADLDAYISAHVG